MALDIKGLVPDPNVRNLSTNSQILKAAQERGKEIIGARFELKSEDNSQVIARGLDEEDCKNKLIRFNSLPTYVRDPVSGAVTINVDSLIALDAVVTGLNEFECRVLRTSFGITDLIEKAAQGGYDAVKHLTDPFELAMEHKPVTRSQ